MYAIGVIMVVGLCCVVVVIVHVGAVIACGWLQRNGRGGVVMCVCVWYGQ